MTVTTTFDGWDAMLERLGAAEETISAEMQAGMEEAMTKLREAEAEYPERVNYHLMGDNPRPFYSPKQQRFFFWALKSGAITVPYVRNGELAGSWQQRVEEISGGVRGVVWTDSPIAPMVMGAAGEQARMFQNVWTPATQRFDAAQETIVNILSERARRMLGDLL
ncbi:MAG: hypothetical protein WCF84_02330 [Anaerolineae bacterium]